MFLFGPYLLWQGAKRKKFDVLKNPCLVYFFKHYFKNIHIFAFLPSSAINGKPKKAFAEKKNWSKLEL